MCILTGYTFLCAATKQNASVDALENAYAIFATVDKFLVLEPDRQPSDQEQINLDVQSRGVMDWVAAEAAGVF